MTHDEFTAWVEGDGFSPTRSMSYEPDQRPPMHAHEFDARLLVTGGELTMALADGSIVLRAGDECDVPTGTVHSEQGGPDGATAILATRDATA
ncbi:MAG: hypothetical protein ABIP17_05170 [Ilumatobacteraceae bacterium]